MTDKPRDPDGPELDREDIRDGGGYYYVAREILVNAADEELVAGALAEYRAVRVEGESLLSRYVVLYRLPTDEPSVPAVVESLRSLDVGREPRVGPNHVVAGTPNYHGGPGAAPIPAPGPLTGRSSTADPVRVAILDTGVAKAALPLPLLKNRFDVQQVDEDAVYDSGTAIALMGGHGTMVAGIVARHAPNAELLSFRVLSPAGLGTESCIADAVLRAVQQGATVLNLSLGGYVMPGQLPTAFDAVLVGLPFNVSVVAAAGNYGRNRPFHPASHDRVVGVAAFDTTFAVSPPAGFSNFGPWVSAAGPGVRIYGPYVTGTWSHKQMTQSFTGHAAWSGTSFAAPHVAAVIADSVAGNTAREAEAAVLAAGVADPDYGVPVIPANVEIY